MTAPGGAFALAHAPVPGQARGAVAEILRQFDQHRIVMLGELHGSIQFDDLLKRLVSTPASAERGIAVVVPRQSLTANLPAGEGPAATPPG
jgi:hypothetical protein